MDGTRPPCSCRHVAQFTALMSLLPQICNDAALPAEGRVCPAEGVADRQRWYARARPSTLSSPPPGCAPYRRGRDSVYSGAQTS